MIYNNTYKKIAQGMLALLVGSLMMTWEASGGEASVITPDTGRKPAAVPKRANLPQPSPSSAHASEADGAEAIDVQKKSGVDNIIRIGIGDGVAKGVISSANGMNALKGTDGRLYDEFKSNSVASVSAAEGKLFINGKKTGIASMVFTPVDGSGKGKIKYNGHEYRGQLVVSAAGSSLTIVNRLSLEDYLKGVLPSEMSPSWPGEALKAQAVAARTFTLYTKNQKAHFGSGYDLCDSTHCQAYDGVENEEDTSSAAVEATAGQTMTHEGKPIYAAFHSSSGGYTENSEDVWGNYLPYLRAVKDDDSKSPFHNWSVRFTAAEVERLLSAAGKNIGQLKGVSMTTSGGSPDAHGIRRAKEVKFAGTGETIVLDAYEVRRIFGLKSTFFNIRTERPVTLPPVKRDAKGNSTKKTIDTAPAAMHGAGLQVENASVAVIFDGHGFGHGLGMSQYGAKAMAESGKKYDGILHHYYTDIKISKLY